MVLLQLLLIWLLLALCNGYEAIERLSDALIHLMISINVIRVATVIWITRAVVRRSELIHIGYHLLAIPLTQERRG